MVINFSILGVIMFVSMFWEKGTRKIKASRWSTYIMPLLPFLLVFGYITFLAAMRTNVNDTHAYKQSFENLPGTLENINAIIMSDGKDKGFNILGNLFKMFISTDYHMWFALFAIIESAIFIHILRRETVSLLDTCFYLFSSTLYYNYFSMMRQWFAVSLFFLAFKWMKRREFIPYLLICLFAAQFHNSAYMCIPIYFLVNDEPFSKKQMVYILVLCIAVFGLSPILSSLGSSDSTYSYVYTTMTGNSGSSPVRILIASVPILISLLYRNKIRALNNQTLNMSLNLSMFNLLLTVLATFTSGLYIIRFATYFSIFNMILFPFLLEMVLKGENRKIIKVCFFVFYFIFYIYQMNHQGSFGYSSDVIGTYY